MPSLNTGNAILSNAITVDGSYRVGIGITPSSWSGFNTLQVGALGLWSTSANNSHYSSNLYYDGTDRRYISSDFALEYNQQSGVHKWLYASSGTAGAVATLTEAMRITSSGDVQISSRNLLVTKNTSNEIGLWVKGIGTYSSGYASIQSFASDVTYDTRLILQENGGRVGIGTTNTTYATLNVKASGTFLYNGIAIYSTNGTESFLGLGNSGSEVGLFATYGASGSYLPITFSTGGSERMRITSGGNVNINTTGNAYSTAAQMNLVYNGAAVYGFNMKTTSGDGIHLNFVNTAGTQVGYIYSKATSTGYYTSSDYRLKQDLKDYNALEILCKIKTYDYEWKNDNSRMHGVMAHELQEVIPYAVSGEKDGERIQGVDYSTLVPILIKSIQELSAKLTDQQQQINQLINK